MRDQLIERTLYAAIAAVLVVPEPATFVILVSTACGVAAFFCRFAWTLISDGGLLSDESAAHPATLREPA